MEQVYLKEGRESFRYFSRMDGKYYFFSIKQYRLVEVIVVLNMKIVIESFKEQEKLRKCDIIKG